MIDPITPDFVNTPVSGQRPSFGYTPADPIASPYVTIITPFYNTGPIFHETARSVLQQSCQQWEWLIINDGSTDPEALAILETYRQFDPRIQIINQNNRGPGAARNTGFQAARTEYIVQLDSDDLLEPTAIEKWFWFLESYPEFAFCKGYSIGFAEQEYLWDKGFHNGEAILYDNQVDIVSMIRKDVYQIVGGHDEVNNDGFEDWDFWLRCASFGYWGSTIPEYLNWYRRRPNHNDRWTHWDFGQQQRAFRKQMRQRYPRLWNSGFPKIQPRWQKPHDTVPDELPCENRLQKDNPRLLMILPWLTMGGADKFNLDLLQQLTCQGWEVSIATTLNGDHSWLPEFACSTPDIFILHHFLRLVDYPRFLQYLIHSRQIDVVMVSNSELGYLLLPYLRAHFPAVTFVDFSHMEEEYWKNGGYPRMAVEYQESLDLNIVSSEHLKDWMVQRGANSEQIEVCYTNIDSDKWSVDADQARLIRQEFGVANTTPIILYAARIHRQKQPRVLAQTILQLAQQDLDFVTLVAGDGPEMDWLRSFIQLHKLNDRIHLLGALSNQRVKQLMMAANIFFLPSLWEGIALSIYEAMACGLPIVGANVGGQRELVTPECGILIDRGDEETETQQYVEALSKLLKNPQRGRDMGQTGRIRVRTHFRLEQMGERMGQLIAESKKLSQQQPRPQPGIGLGRVCASQAVEYIRVSQLADQLWTKYNNKDLQDVRFLPWGNHNGINWSERIYLTLYRWHEPYYYWYTKRGWTWLTPIRNKLTQILLHQNTR